MRRRDTSHSFAGWVFADALLAMTIIGLAAGGAVSAGAEPPAPVAVVAPEPTPVPTPEPAPPAPPAPPADGVAQAPVVLELPLRDASDEAVRAAVAGAVGELAAQGRRAAFVLTFGTASDPAAGTALARRVNAQLDAAAGAVFAGSAKRDFWRAVNATSPETGVVRLEVYLLQQ
ncbi:hypothetical protein [Kineococcus arenarius]|uniref:hypothetical protein n=1 Tax=Kineococcus sp. SYSU DK007 TaxID=3383128 RepID=UPI003D7E309C